MSLARALICKNSLKLDNLSTDNGSVPEVSRFYSNMDLSDIEFMTHRNTYTITTTFNVIQHAVYDKGCSYLCTEWWVHGTLQQCLSLWPGEPSKVYFILSQRQRLHLDSR